MSDIDPSVWQVRLLSGVPVDSPRLTVLEEDGELVGFDVACTAGTTQVRLDKTAGIIVGHVAPDGGVVFEGEIDPDNWGPWHITAGPDDLVGARFTDAGVAVRAAMRGWRWPDTWPADAEPQLGTMEFPL